MRQEPEEIPSITSGEICDFRSAVGNKGRIEKESNCPKEQYKREEKISVIAVAQITTDPGELRRNLEKIVSFIGLARGSGAQLVVFPELTLPGFCHMDLAFNPKFRADQLTALEHIRDASHGITVIVGHMLEDEGVTVPSGRPHLRSVATIIKDGEVLHTQEKSLLPNHELSPGRRYYHNGDVPKAFQLGDLKVGLIICEDIWTDGYETDPVEELARQKVDLVINTSASPFEVGKMRQRKELLSEVAIRVGAPVVYANLVGSFDGYDAEIVFDGRSMLIGKDGEVSAVAKGFTEDLKIFDLRSLREVPSQTHNDLEELHDALVLGIREYFRRNGFQRAYVGLSGGIDSALVAALCVEALGREHVVGVTMPSHITSDETRRDAHLLANNLGMKCFERSIEPEYEAWLAGYRQVYPDREPAAFTKQNKQARIRGSILLEYTNEDRSGLVVSTGNKTELALGYCTLYGDKCGGFAAINDVDKPGVYALSLFINERAGRCLIPEGTLTRTPSAELEEGQTDTANLPAEFDLLSPLVDEIVEDNATLEELLSRYPKEVIDRTMSAIDAQEYKRRQVAPGIRVTSRGFGIERRMPMGLGYRRSQLC
ncbi:MAG: NAD+ synthase [Bdellovibrionales bacterium]|nr:NAD+ synthase [Bdellovibrionales bacterium]